MLLRLVVRPISGAWNVLGIGLPGVVAVVLWGRHHALLALNSVQYLCNGTGPPASNRNYCDGYPLQPVPAIVAS